MRRDPPSRAFEAGSLAAVGTKPKGCPLNDSTFREVWLIARICRLVRKIWGSRCEKKWFQMILKQHLVALLLSLLLFLFSFFPSDFPRVLCSTLKKSHGFRWHVTGLTGIFAISLARKHPAASQRAQSTYQANAGIWIVSFFFSKTRRRHEIKPLTTMTCDLPSTRHPLLFGNSSVKYSTWWLPANTVPPTRRGAGSSLHSNTKRDGPGASSGACWGFPPAPHPHTEAPPWRPPPMLFAAVKETGAKLPNMWAYCGGISRLMILRCNTWLSQKLYILLTWVSFKDWIFVM